jgi:hypothetical protein
MKRVLLYACVALLAAQVGCSKSNQTNANATANANSNAQANPGSATVSTTPVPNIPDATSAQTNQKNPTLGAAPANMGDMSLEMLASDFHAALLQGRKPQLEAMLADNYKGTQADGSVVNKQQLLASLKESQQMFTLNANKPDVKGDTATVTGTFSLNSMEQTKQNGKSFQFTDTYHKQGDKWLVVSSKVVEQKS